MSAGLALDASVFGNGHANGNGNSNGSMSGSGNGHHSNGSIGSSNGHGTSHGNGFDLSSLAMSLHKVASSSTMGNDDDNEEVLTFESPKEEAGYYRDKYRVAVDLLNETRAELDEFQVSSRELEAELEKELEATEARQAELRDRIQRLEIDRDDWKTKYVNLQKMHSSTTSAMQREMDNLRSERDKALVAVRDLEMGNDQLERNERVAVSSLLDMEIKYNRAIEEKTLLEQEVIQKNELEEECQRLKDDVRDANNEIAILRDQLERAVVPTPPSSDAHMSPAPDRTLHSRTTSRSDSRSDMMASPTPTDFSSATERSSRSTATERTDKSTAVTPRNPRIPVQSPRRVPRSTSTPTALTSPTVKRTVSGVAPSPSTSGIPALSRTTASRNLSSSTNPLGMSTTRRVFGSGTGANAANRPPSSQAGRKGFKLLHDLQARIKTTDDKIGKMVKKAPSGFATRPRVPPPAPASATSTSSSLSSSTMRARTASRSRANTQLAMSSLTSSTATVTPGARDEKAVGFLSPTSWVLLSDPDETPPATIRDSQLNRSQTPSSPLERSRARTTSTSRGRTLPSRPSIPSPLVRETKARHGTSESMKLRHGLSASTMVPPTNPRTRPPLTASTGRPPSRGHVRAASTVGPRSGASSPSLLPGPRRLSMGVTTTTMDLASPTTTGRMSASTSRPPSRGAAGFGPRTTPVTRSHTPSGSLSSLPSATTTGGAPPPIIPPRRPPRRSSMGVPDDGPPSAIPGPKLGGLPSARPTSFPNTNVPPVPRLPSQIRGSGAGGI